MSENLKKFLVYVLVAVFSAVGTGLTTYFLQSCSTTLNAEKLEFSTSTKDKSK